MAASAPATAPAGLSTPEACLGACARLVLPAGAPVLLGVSGGSDSMTLLALAHAHLPGRVRVVHVQHGLRPDAIEDEAFVRAQCAARGLPCRVIEARPTAADPGRTETAARARRMLALQLAAQECGARCVLLAHHRDDALETLLLHLQRGHRGDRALAGIPAVRRLGGEVRLVRPFLCTPRAPGRAELAAWRHDHDVPYIEDPSNRDLRVPRNRLRAWLAADGAGEVDALLGLAARARARLRQRLGHVAARLAEGLVPDGLGARLDASALRPHPQDDPLQDGAELLRLLGPCLQAARRIDPRASVLQALRDLQQRGHGELLLPATPRRLRLRASRNALHLPDEGLVAGDAEARVLAALAMLSLWVD